MIDYKILQKQKLYEAGWVEAWDCTYQRIEELDNYNTKPKPLIPLKTRLIHEGMCRKGFITNNFEDYFQSAKDFLKSINQDK